MKVKLDRADKLREYLVWHISKAHNIPMLTTALAEAQRMLEEYKRKDYPEVRIKLS